MSLPQANVVCKKVFSIVNRVKTKFQNKNKKKTTANYRCIKFEPTKKNV